MRQAALKLDERYTDRCWLSGHEVTMQPLQYRLLRFLAETPRRVVPRKEIYSHLYGDRVVEDNQISLQIRKLRKALSSVTKLADGGIETVNGEGVRIIWFADQVEIRKADVSQSSKQDLATRTTEYRRRA